jgi:hypothetical protein
MSQKRNGYFGLEMKSVSSLHRWKIEISPMPGLSSARFLPSTF